MRKSILLLFYCVVLIKSNRLIIFTVLIKISIIRLFHLRLFQNFLLLCNIAFLFSLNNIYLCGIKLFKLRFIFSLLFRGLGLLTIIVIIYNFLLVISLLIFLILYLCCPLLRSELVWVNHTASAALHIF